MGDESEPLTAEERMPPEISHRRILRYMVGVIVVGTIAGAVFFSVMTGLGVLVGGILGFANYYWQKQSLNAIFDRAVHGEGSRFLAIRYIFRYVVIGGALTGIYFTATVSIFGVIFGLASFAIAVVIEGFASIFSSSNRQDS